MHYTLAASLPLEPSMELELRLSINQLIKYTLKQKVVRRLNSIIDAEVPIKEQHFFIHCLCCNQLNLSI